MIKFRAQFQLMSILGQHGRVTVVGDENQVPSNINANYITIQFYVIPPLSYLRFPRS